MHDHAVVLPSRFALGDVIRFYLRRIALIEAKRLTVCCPRAHRHLYPTATDFHDVPEKLSTTEVAEASILMQRSYPCAHIYEVGHDLPRGEADIEIKPAIVIAPRWKPGQPWRNWPHWNQLCLLLQQRGHSVITAGLSKFSAAVDCPAAEDVSAMTAAILSAPLTISTDSAAAHLAILLRRPLAVLWGDEIGVIPGQTYQQGAHAMMERQKRAPVHHLVGAWASAEHALALLTPHLPSITSLETAL